MRFTKMLGLAAIAAVAAMAFVGVSSAMASGSTALCNNETLPCDNVYTGHVEATASNPVLLSSLGTVKCNTSTILGNALGLANPLVGHIESITFTGDCLRNNEGSECTITATELGLLLLLKTKANHGTLSAHNTKVKVVCSGISCTFNLPLATELLVEGATAGTLAKIVASEEVLEGSGFLCPSTGKWDATYLVQLPHGVRISS